MTALPARISRHRKRLASPVAPTAISTSATAALACSYSYDLLQPIWPAEAGGIIASTDALVMSGTGAGVGVLVAEDGSEIPLEIEESQPTIGRFVSASPIPAGVYTFVYEPAAWEGEWG